MPFAAGWAKGGRQGARDALADFWGELGKQMPLGFVTQGEGEAISLSPAIKMLASWVGYFSPSQFNPLALSPLRDLLQRQLDFGQLRGHSPFKLFVGQPRPTPASCGCFGKRNPAVFPLFYECDSRDVLLVLLSPLERESTPTTVEEIEQRIIEIAFSANFMRGSRSMAMTSDGAPRST